MAKVQIKSEKITPFGGIFHVRELFSRFVGPVIDKVLGLRCTSFGYQYGEIVGSLSSVYFCGGDCVEDGNVGVGSEAVLEDVLDGDAVADAARRQVVGMADIREGLDDAKDFVLGGARQGLLRFF